MSKHEEKKMMLESSGLSMEKAEKKERSSKCKDKSLRDKGLTEEEKEQRKERKLGRKRDRAEEALLAEQKRRKEEEKAAKIANHQNGANDLLDIHSSRDKHHYSRQYEKEDSFAGIILVKDKSPYRERERSHDRDGRDKHRRESKRR